MDTEFTGLHKNTTLISIGLVSECGKTFYSEFTDFDKTQVDSWIQQNVIDNLILSIPDGVLTFQATHTPDDFTVKGDKRVIVRFLHAWLSQFDKIQIISDVLAYDWVLFCDIFGSTFDIPKNVSYLPLDLATMFYMKGIDPDINRQEFCGLKNTQHNALDDAKVIKVCFEKLMEGIKQDDN